MFHVELNYFTKPSLFKIHRTLTLVELQEFAIGEFKKINNDYRWILNVSISALDESYYAFLSHARDTTINPETDANCIREITDIEPLLKKLAPETTIQFTSLFQPTQQEYFLPMLSTLLALKHNPVQLHFDADLISPDLFPALHHAACGNNLVLQLKFETYRTYSLNSIKSLAQAITLGELPDGITLELTGYITEEEMIILATALESINYVKNFSLEIALKFKQFSYDPTSATINRLHPFAEVNLDSTSQLVLPKTKSDLLFFDNMKTMSAKMKAERDGLTAEDGAMLHDQISKETRQLKK